ncbi:calcium-binding protein [Plastoroseomonas arctica]|uniref:Calcium-binding protein n=1 Tax=Plastoroseomonas arctica TaxID=1509237 RepID=A0AAF1KQ09_9PROT|nr:calcium-binding protein [Plastoroseomonas arctica]MBR0656848.1 calcium-binding protein [Plastoroseomonas arctica]
MASFQFSVLAGSTFAFNTFNDQLVFGANDLAGNLRFLDSAGGLIVSHGGQSVTLSGVTFGALRSSNFGFPNGGQAQFDGSSSDSRIGTAASDFLGMNAGGNDTILGGGGDDVFHANGNFTAADMLDGGAGSGDTLRTYGNRTHLLTATSLVGVELIELASGNTRIDLAANTASSATPAPGAMFTIDGRALTANWLRVEGGAEIAAAMALLGGGAADTLAGGGGGDSLLGGVGEDSLVGGGGNDTLRGGLGSDTLIGGAGADVYAFDEAPGVSAPTLTDMIVGFKGAGVASGDLIALPQGTAFAMPLRFSLDPVPFAFTGYGATTPQMPAFMIGDGFADVVWTLAVDPNYRFLVWVDGNDNGLFDATDMLIRVGQAAGETTPRLGVDDFLVDFAGYVGSAGDDCLVGRGIQDDVIYGMGGQDTLVAGAGVNVLDGGDGQDSLLGGDLYDELYGGAGADTLDGGGGGDVLFAGIPGMPEREDASTRNLLVGGVGDDQVYGGSGTDTLLGGDDADLLWADAGADSLDGGEGDDTLFAGSGGDTLHGGAGVDHIYVDLTLGIALSPPANMALLADLDTAAGEIIALGAEDGLLNGPAGFASIGFGGLLAARDVGAPPAPGLALPVTGAADNPYTVWWVPALAGGAPAGGWVLIDLDRDGRLSSPDFLLRVLSDVADPRAMFGTALTQSVQGSDAAERLDAYALGGHVLAFGGADTVVGAAGFDTLEGGAGADTLRGGGGDDSIDGGTGADTMLGGPGNDAIRVDDPGDRSLENAGEGADTVYAAVSHYLGANVEALVLEEGAGDLFGVGNSANNLLVGNSGTSLLIAHDGADTVLGGAGRDLLFGMVGDDRLIAGDGIDYLVGDVGNDWMDGGNGPDEMYGQAGNNTLVGGGDFATDILVGGSGNDSIDGGPAWDLMYGNQGDDTFFATQQVDWVFEFPGEGHDLVIANSPNGFYLYANIEDLTLVGSTPFGVGNALANRITGNALFNTLLGGDGADTLQGSAGNDILWGQGGTDLFIVGRGDGAPVVADFVAGQDRLMLLGTGIADFAGVMARMSQVGANAALDLGQGERIIFVGLQSGTLTGADFIFQP